MISEEAPKLSNGQVLIKVAYAPVSNYDKACLTLKKESSEGKVFGSEGCGTIVDIASDVDSSLKGRKVAFCHEGWQQFVVKDQNRLLMFEDSVDLKTISAACINPLTALSLKNIVRDAGQKSVVFIGAGSSLGRMYIKCCQYKNIDCIAICRGQDELKSIKEETQNNTVLDYESSDFQDQFSKFIDQFSPRFLIDSVGGQISGKIFQSMPAKAEMILLGNLSNEDLSLSTTELFMHGKTITGFDLETHFMERLSEERRRYFMKIIQDDINSGGKYFGTTSGQELKFEEFNQALDMTDMSAQEGKLLLKMY